MIRVGEKEMPLFPHGLGFSRRQVGCTVFIERREFLWESHPW
jgi:hypothetical protein